MYGNYTGAGGYGVNPYQQQFMQNRVNQPEQYTGGTYPVGNYQMQNNVQSGAMQIIKGRPVSSYDEAKASMIDLDGSLFVFTDIANNCIYTKQILLDGSAELKTYVLQEQKQGRTKQKESVNENFVSKKEFEIKIKEVNKQIEEMKEALSYDSNDDKSNAKK